MQTPHGMSHAQVVGAAAVKHSSHTVKRSSDAVLLMLNTRQTQAPNARHQIQCSHANHIRYSSLMLNTHQLPLSRSVLSHELAFPNSKCAYAGRQDTHAQTRLHGLVMGRAEDSLMKREWLSRAKASNMPVWVHGC